MAWRRRTPQIEPVPEPSRASRQTLLTLWETRSSRALRAIGLDSVRTTIFTLAVLASLIPALATGCISYRQNRRAIEDKLTEQLAGLSTQAAREMDLWVKEGVYNLKVFAASYEVSENVTRSTPQTRVRLTDYLKSVRGHFPDVEELLVVTTDARIVGSSERTPGRLHFRGDWLQPARTGDPVLGDPYRRDSASDIAMEVAVPILGPSGHFLGVLAARLNFSGARQSLSELAAGRQTRLLVLDHLGHVIVFSGRGTVTLTEAARHRLEGQEGTPVTYDDPDGTGLVGALAPIHRTNWSAVADMPQATAFAQIRRLRNTTILLVLVLLVVVGSLAYALGNLIVRPLGRLSRAATRVAGGDLEVWVPSIGGGELSQLTDVFNDMVRRLREGREELERLSVTDPLTGLANRRRLMAELEREVLRSGRLERPCAVMMLDVDHFKHFNDTYGHPAGDEVLRRLADVLRRTVREVDTPARYGGEEFMVILPETPHAQAAAIAERIRARVADERFAPAGDGEQAGVTISIGLAGFPGDGTSPEALIEAADDALYRAKEGGRNRVVAARKDRASGGASKKPG